MKRDVQGPMERNMKSTIRPLRRCNPGKWESRDRRWVFMRHWSDPVPGRWFAYLDGDSEPENVGLGHVALWEVVEWVEALSDPSGNENHLAPPGSPKPRVR